MSVIITAMKIIMISLNMKFPGLKIPFRATSIIPLEKTAPKATPILAQSNGFQMKLLLNQ